MKGLPSMHCQRCPRDAVGGIRQRLCECCFCQWMERRIARELREHDLLKKDATFVVDHALCEHVLKSIVKGMPVTIMRLDDKDEHSTQKTAESVMRVLCWTLDDEIVALLEAIFSGEKPTGLGHHGAIKLFLPLTDAEVSVYAKAKGFPFTPKPKENVQAILERLEKNHPETRFSIASSAKDIAAALEEE